MAKVVGPLLSMDAKGSVGDALTFSSWRGQATARIKSNPSNPKSTNQMKSRAYFSVIGKVTKKANLAGDVVQFMREKTPARQSWASYFGREMLGTNNVNIRAIETAYKDAGNSSVKAFFDTAATTHGIEAIDLDGTTNTQIAAGLIVAAAYDASYRLGDPKATKAFASATSTEVQAYAAALFA